MVFFCLPAERKKEMGYYYKRNLLLPLPITSNTHERAAAKMTTKNASSDTPWKSKKFLRSPFATVVGSSLLWAWGFLCFLSPTMFPQDFSMDVSIGIEYGFFASQAGAVTFAVIVMIASRWRPLVIPHLCFFIAALLVSLSSVVLAWALQSSLLWLVILCGIVDGFGVPLLGVAWGARYSLGSSGMRPLVVLSFLISYLLYFLILALPQAVALTFVCLMPLISWTLWNSDARMRHRFSAEVFPVRGSEGVPAMPGELSVGSWETSILPWRPIGVLILASFVGNLMASVIMGQGYLEVDGLFRGGIVVCACIATMSLVPLTANRSRLSVSSIYRITLTFTALGLVSLLVFGSSALTIGGALVQGSAFFLQVLVILKITQSTQEQGISPLLSFSVGQGLIAGVVFLGNVLGKQVFELFGSSGFVLDVVCGCGLLALFFMLIARASDQVSPSIGGIIDEDDNLEAHIPENFLSSSDNRISASIDGESSAALSEEFWTTRINSFSQEYDLTKRESEVFYFLAKGHSLPHIADTLFVTTGTIKTHTMHIYRKLSINSRQELLDLFERSTPRPPRANP